MKPHEDKNNKKIQIMGAGRSMSGQIEDSKDEEKILKQQVEVQYGEEADATAFITLQQKKLSGDSSKYSLESSCSGSGVRRSTSKDYAIPTHTAGTEQLYSNNKLQQSNIQEDADERIPPLRTSISTVRSSSDGQGSVASSMYHAICCSVSINSGRNSIALERVALDSTRPSADIFQDYSRQSLESRSMSSSNEDIEKLPSDPLVQQLEAALQQLPDVLREAYKKTAVFPKDMPVPIGLLTMLWECGSDNASATTAAMLEQRGLVKSAILENGTIWILVPWEVLRLVKSIVSAQPGLLAKYHGQLIQSYLNRFGQDLSLIHDDGYILKNITTHLKESNYFDQFRQLLMNISWLEFKKRHYGAISVVEDFRMYMQARPEADVKLLLQAFQMAESCCQAFPNISMLRQQLIGRLMAISESPDLPHLKDWCERERNLNPGLFPAGVRHLMPKTPTLGQAGGLMRMTLRGHTDGITALDLSYDGLKVITASKDTTAKIWDLQIGDCIATLQYHHKAIKCVRSVPNSNLVVTGGEDGFGVVWDIETGTKRVELHGHQSSINAICVECYGTYAVTASSDHSCRVWNVHLGSLLHVFQGHVSVVWDVTIVGNKVVSVSEDFTGRVWDISTGKCTGVLQGHSGWVVSVAPMPSHNQCVTASHDCTARLWDILSGECLQVLEGHSGRINKVVVSNDQSRVVTISDDFTGLLWDVRQECGGGKVVVAELEGHSGWVSDVVFSGDNQSVVTGSGDGLAAVWDAETGAHTALLQGHSNELTCVTTTHKGRFIVSGSQDGTARVWDIKAADVQVVESHQCKVLTLSVSQKHQVVISTSEDGGIYWWSAVDGTNIRRLAGHNAAIHWATIAIDTPPQQTTSPTQQTQTPESTPDASTTQQTQTPESTPDASTTQETETPESTPNAGEEILVTASGDRRVCVWSVESGELLRTQILPGGSRLKWFASSCEGNKGVAVLFDSSVWLVCLKTLGYIRQLQTWGEGGSEVHKSGVNAVYVDKVGKLAMTVAKDFTGRLWNLEQENAPSCILQGHSDGVSSGDMSSDGLLAASCSYDQTVRLWDVLNSDIPSQISSLTLEHNVSVSIVKLSLDRTRVLSVTQDNLAWLWDIQRGCCIACLRGHQDEVLGAKFSCDSKFVATFSKDNTVHVWKCLDGCLTAFYMADSEITTLSYISQQNEDVSGIVVGDANGLVHFLDLP